MIFKTVGWFRHILIIIESCSQRNHPEDGRMSDRNMLVTTIY